MQKEKNARPGNESPLPADYWPAGAAAAGGRGGAAESAVHFPAADTCGSKAHLTRTVGGMGQAAAAVPPEVMEVYREMFPDWSTRRIEEDYEKHKE